MNTTLFTVLSPIKVMFHVFLSETCVFAYLGMAIFSFKHQLRPAFVIWTIVRLHKKASISASKKRQNLTYLFFLDHLDFVFTWKRSEHLSSFFACESIQRCEDF